jgi:hypothetical protein
LPAAQTGFLALAQAAVIIPPDTMLRTVDLATFWAAVGT